MIIAFRMLDQVQSPGKNTEREKGFCKKRFVINRNSRNKLYWDLFVNTVMLFTYIRVPYNIAFGAPKCDAHLERFVEIFIDMVILVDIVCSFITDGYSSPG